MNLLFDQNLSGNAPTNQVETIIRAGKEAIQELLENPTFHRLELH